MAFTSTLEGGKSNPDTMGTSFRSCYTAFSFNGPLGIHGKNKCNKFSGLSESDYYLT